MNSQISLDACIENANLSVQCLTLKAEIARVKSRREQSKQKFVKTREHYETRKAEAYKYFHQLVFSDAMLKEYIDVIKSKGQEVLPSYILQQQAKLYKYARHEELLQIYLRLLEQHSEDLISDMEKAKNNMIIGLMKQEENIDVVMEEMVELVAKQVHSFHSDSGNLYTEDNATKSELRRSSLMKSLKVCSRRQFVQQQCVQQQIPNFIEITRS